MKHIVILSICVMLFCSRAIASVEDDVKKANGLYNDKKYREAAALYGEALKKMPSYALANFNNGAALYKSSSYSQSVDAFNKAITSGRDKIIQASDYNIGNAYYRIGGQKAKAQDTESAKRMYENALKYYKRAITLDAKDRDAKYNYEFVSNKLKELKDNRENKQEEKQRDQKKKDEDKNREKNKPDEKQGAGQKKDKQEDAGLSGQGRSEKNDKKDSGQGSEGDNSQKQGASGEEKETEGGSAQDQTTDEKSEGSEKVESGRENKEREGEAQEESGSREETAMTGAESGTGRTEKARAEGGDGLQFYQPPQKEGEEMSKQQAKMLLEGYKGEEATGRAIRMMRQPVDLAEPEKDW